MGISRPSAKVVILSARPSPSESSRILIESSEWFAGGDEEWDIPSKS